MDSEEIFSQERACLIHFLGQVLGAQAHERLLGQGGELDAQAFREEMKSVVERDTFWDLLANTHVDRISKDILTLGTMYGDEADEKLVRLAAQIPDVCRKAVAQRTKSTGSA